VLKIAPLPADTAAEFHDTERYNFDVIAETGGNIATTLDDRPIIIIIVIVVVVVVFVFCFCLQFLCGGMDAIIFPPFCHIRPPFFPQISGSTWT
jgi:hypothetical protein